MLKHKINTPYLEGKRELTQSAVTCPAHDTCLLPDCASYPGHVAQHVSVHPRPPVPQATLGVTKTDHSEQDKVPVKPPEFCSVFMRLNRCSYRVFHNNRPKIMAHQNFGALGHYFWPVIMEDPVLCDEPSS